MAHVDPKIRGHQHPDRTLQEVPHYLWMIVNRSSVVWGVGVRPNTPSVGSSEMCRVSISAIEPHSSELTPVGIPAGKMIMFIPTLTMCVFNQDLALQH